MKKDGEAGSQGRLFLSVFLFQKSPGSAFQACLLAGTEGALAECTDGV